jgi:hypothetical protein
MSKRTQTKKQAQAEARERLEREAASIAGHFGHSLGCDLMYYAAEAFEATPESFDAEGRLTDEAGDEFLRVIGENWDTVRDNACHYLCQITRTQLNTLREQQGLPPV